MFVFVADADESLLLGEDEEEGDEVSSTNAEDLEARLPIPLTGYITSFTLDPESDSERSTTSSFDSKPIVIVQPSKESVCTVVIFHR